MLDYFVIGVYSASPWGYYPDGRWGVKAGFDKWTGLGCNTTFCWENGGLRPENGQPYITYDSFLQQAEAAKLNCIVQLPPFVSPEDYVNRSIVKGVVNAPKYPAVADPRYYGQVADEPDRFNVPVQLLVDEYKRLKQFTSKPVWLNFSSDSFMGWKPPGGRDWYKRAIQEACDIVSYDLYPIGGWGQPAWQNSLAKDDRWVSEGGTPPRFNDMIDRIFALGGKWQFGFVELGVTSKRRRGPTPAEIRGQIWASVILGCKGIIYWTFLTDGGWSADSSTDLAKAEMKASNADLAKLGDVLVKGVYQRLPQRGAFMSARWTYQGKAYTITLNNTVTPQALDGRDYQPYGYSVDVAAAGQEPQPPSTDPPPTPADAGLTEVAKSMTELKGTIDASQGHIAALTSVTTGAAAKLAEIEEKLARKRVAGVTVNFTDGTSQSLP